MLYYLFCSSNIILHIILLINKTIKILIPFLQLQRMLNRFKTPGQSLHFLDKLIKIIDFKYLKYFYSCLLNKFHYLYSDVSFGVNQVLLKFHLMCPKQN